MHSANFKSRISQTVTYSAVILPFLLLLYIFTSHNALEDIMLYNKTLIKMLFLSALAAVTAASFIVDTIREKSASKTTLIISVVTLAVSLYFASYLLIPRYIRHGVISTPNFLSSSPKQKIFHFAAAGDAHIGNGKSRTDITMKILDNIAQDRYDAFFLLGDLVDRGFDYGLWVKSFQDMEFINTVMPTCYIPGNHDTIFGGDEFYHKYSLPDNSKTMWRRIDIGNIHFIVLDIEWVTETYTKEQEKWLKNQLASIPREDWCIVLGHTFYYCSGKKKDGWDWYDNKRLIKRLCPLFEYYGVDLVLSGHMHQMEILQKSGVTYAVMGSMGGELDTGRNYVSPASIWYTARQFGFLDVCIKENKAQLKVMNPESRELFSIDIVNR